jgi:hypothetical protein
MIGIPNVDPTTTAELASKTVVEMTTSGRPNLDNADAGTGPTVRLGIFFLGLSFLFPIVAIQAPVSRRFGAPLVLGEAWAPENAERYKKLQLTRDL